MQGCSGARAWCPRWLVSVQLTHKVTCCTRVDGSKHNCPKPEVDTLADRQPVQPPLQLSGTRTTWRLSDHMAGRGLYAGLQVLTRGSTNLHG